MIANAITDSTGKPLLFGMDSTNGFQIDHGFNNRPCKPHLPKRFLQGTLLDIQDIDNNYHKLVSHIIYEENIPPHKMNQKVLYVNRDSVYRFIKLEKSAYCMYKNSFYHYKLR